MIGAPVRHTIARRGVIPEQNDRISDQCERFPQQIAGRLRHRALHLCDVVGHARQQLSRRVSRKEARRLSEDVAVKPVAEIHHHALPDVFHQIAGEVRSDALDEVERNERERDRLQRRRESAGRDPGSAGSDR